MVFSTINARIPPQTPPAGEKQDFAEIQERILAEVLRNPFPQKMLSQNRVRIYI